MDRAVLCERDPDVSNLWRCMLDDAEGLARRVERFAATPENVRAVIAAADVSGMDAAFRTLLWNRISRGGIMAKGRFGDEAGREWKGDRVALVRGHACGADSHDREPCRAP